MAKKSYKRRRRVRFFACYFVKISDLKKADHDEYTLCMIERGPLKNSYYGY
jgi:hypothetical protein